MRFVAEVGIPATYLLDTKCFIQEWFTSYADNPAEGIQPKYWEVNYSTGHIIDAKCEFISEAGIKLLSDAISEKFPKIRELILGENFTRLPLSEEIIWHELEKSSVVYNNQPMLIEPCHISVNHISIGQYFDFLDKTSYQPYVDRNEGLGFRKSQIASPGKKAHQWPVSYIVYEDALAFCDWIGGRLPSEVELYRFFQVYLTARKSFEFTNSNWTPTKGSNDEIILINTPWKQSHILPIEEMIFQLPADHYDIPFPSFRVCKDVI